MLDHDRIENDLSRLSLLKNGVWVADVQREISSDHLSDLKRATIRIDLAHRVLFFLFTPADYDFDTLKIIAGAMIRLSGAVHEICICETARSDSERCYLFESGLALVFVHKTSLLAPFSGFAHEFTHALGLSGNTLIDEGLAMLFDKGASAGAINWSPEIEFDLTWCKALARKNVSSANIYALGASYFASIVEEHGIESLLEERQRLEKLGDGSAVREVMRQHLIDVRSRDQQQQRHEVNTVDLNDLYFQGDLDAFKLGAHDLFSRLDEQDLSPDEQLTFGRYLIYLATLEKEEIPSAFLGNLLSQEDLKMTKLGSQLLSIARAMFAAKQSQSHIELIANARKLEHFLLVSLDFSQIKPDALVQLIQFHKYIPRFAGGEIDRAEFFANELSAIYGYENVGQRLLSSIQSGAI